jgi:beta-1,4-mannosyltransferase
MQYHAIALADRLAEVDLIGYAGKPVDQALREHPHIRCHLLPSPARRCVSPSVFIFLGLSILRVLRQFARLIWLLLVVVRKPNCFLVQNPPAIPTLLAALLVARLRGAKLVIDWHNFGYSMLALSLGKSHFAVKLARWYERVLGRRAHAHFCVSRAMQAELKRNWTIDAQLLYDLPADGFATAPAHIRRDLFYRLREVIGYDLGGAYMDGLRRTAIIVSPTSWTADEDFALLLDAVSRCEERFRLDEGASEGKTFPRLLILVTGDGPLRNKYEGPIARLPLRWIRLRALWLSAEDYRLLLGSADLGLCLHRSSSGVDLPMKLADMFGSGLPVCALDYGPCLRERLRHGENGLLFSSSTELAGEIFDLFKGFPQETSFLDQLRRNVKESCGRSWSDEWKEKAQPIFAEL